MRKVFIFFLLPLFAFSQELTPDFLPNLDTLKTSLYNYHLRAAIAEAEIHNYKNRSRWLTFLPSPGWNFVTNAPVVTFSFGDVFKQINLKHINAAAVRSIFMQHETALNAELCELSNNYNTAITSIVSYNAELALLELHKQKFAIVEQKYKNAQILPSDFLNAKIQVNEKILSVVRRLDELHLMRSQLLILAKKGEWVALQSSFITQSQLKSK